MIRHSASLDVMWLRNTVCTCRSSFILRSSDSFLHSPWLCSRICALCTRWVSLIFPGVRALLRDSRIASTAHPWLLSWFIYVFPTSLICLEWIFVDGINLARWIFLFPLSSYVVLIVLFYLYKWWVPRLFMLIWCFKHIILQKSFNSWYFWYIYMPP